MFFYAHSGVRYLVLLAGVIALGYAIYGVATSRPYDRTMYRLSRAFMMLTHLQILLGVALLFTRPFSSQLIGHLMPMVFAAAAATIVPSVMRRRAPEARSYTPHVIATLVALALMVLGIMAIGRSPLGMTSAG